MYASIHAVEVCSGTIELVHSKNNASLSLLAAIVNSGSGAECKMTVVVKILGTLIKGENPSEEFGEN